MALISLACSGADREEGAPPLSDDQARSAVLGELLAQPEQRSGTLRFAFHSIFGRATTVSVEGVADYDRQRYVSRLEVDQPDTVYDTAVIAGFRYEKLVSIKVPGGGGPDFKPQWSSPERWSPRASAPSIPYVPLPFIGEADSDVRRDVSGFDDARRRGVLDAVLTGFSRIGASTQRGTPTVQYRLTFDRDRAKAVLAPESARGVPRIGPEAPALQEVDVWIDHSGRLRRYIWPTWVGTTLDFELWDHGKCVPQGIDVRRLGSGAGEDTRRRHGRLRGFRRHRDAQLHSGCVPGRGGGRDGPDCAELEVRGGSGPSAR